MGDGSASACTAATCKNTPKPICDNSGACVECLTDPDCPSGSLCQGKACVPGCSNSHGCPDGGGLCDPNTKMCKRCMGDGACGGNTPRCDPDAGLCVECLPINDNCGNGSFCGQVNNSWKCQKGCGKNLDCVANSDGGAQTPLCCNHVCVDGASDNANCGTCGT